MRHRMPLIALGIVLLAELPALIPPSFTQTDHFIFWEAGRLVATGGSPYDSAAWTEAQRSYGSTHLLRFIDEGAAVWVYPAWTAFLFVPFGLLPYPAGPWALHLAFLAVGLLSAFLLIRSLPERWSGPAEFALMLVAAFQPFVIAARYGQFASFLLLGVVLVHRGLRHERTWPLAAGALLLFTKPQLFLVLAPVVLVLLARRRAGRPIAIVAGLLALVAAATTALLPSSIAPFLRGAGERAAAFSLYSTTWSFAHATVGDAWPLLGSALVALAVLATVAGVRSLPADLRLAGTVAGATALSLAIAPVAFFYDQLPLAVAVIVAVAVARGAVAAVAVILLAVLLPWVAFFAELGIDPSEAQPWSGVVPVAIATLLWLAARSATLRRARPAS